MWSVIHIPIGVGYDLTAVMQYIPSYRINRVTTRELTSLVSNAFSYWNIVRFEGDKVSLYIKIYMVNKLLQSWSCHLKWAHVYIFHSVCRKLKFCNMGNWITPLLGVTTDYLILHLNNAFDLTICSYTLDLTHTCSKAALWNMKQSTLV